MALLALACVGLAPAYSFLLGAALEGMTADAASRAAGPLVAVGSLGGTMVPALLVTQGDRAVLVWVAALLVVAAAAATRSTGTGRTGGGRGRARPSR